MIRTPYFLQLAIIAGLFCGLNSTASAQSHGLAVKKFLQPEKSAKSLQPQVLGLADKSHVLDKKAGAVTGGLSAGKAKSLALRNRVGAQAETLKPLKNKITVDSHPGESDWQVLFDGIEVKAESSKGQLPTGKSFLQDRSALKKSLDTDTSHGLANSPWSQGIKNAEGLK